MSDPLFNVRRKVRASMRKNYHACREGPKERAYRRALEKIANARAGESTDDLKLTALNALIKGEKPG